MIRSGYAAAALLAGTLLGAGPALGQGHADAAPPFHALTSAPAREASALGAALSAADQGDLGPLRRLLPASRGDAAVLIRGRLATAGLDTALADPALARIAAGRDPEMRAAALAILTADAFLRGAYADAVRWGRALGEAEVSLGHAEEAQDSAHQWQIAALLAGHPPQYVEGPLTPRTIEARTDRVGLPRIDVAVNGQMQETLFDTGAGLSALSAETARRLGVTVIEGGAQVGNGIQGTVAVRLGVVDRLEIAGATLRNVPFLIIDDAQLTFPVPGGYDIRAIIGLPVMRALQRMRMEPAAGRFTLLPPREATPAAPNLAAAEGKLFVTVAVDGRGVPLHLDTGANRSSLSALYAAANPERIASLETGQARTASAGGAASAQVATWRNAPLAFGGRSLVLPILQIALPSASPHAPHNYGQLGSEALRAFESYTLDFEAMRLDLGPPVPAAAPAALPAATH